MECRKSCIPDGQFSYIQCSFSIALGLILFFYSHCYCDNLSSEKGCPPYNLIVACQTLEFALAPKSSVDPQLAGLPQDTVVAFLVLCQLFGISHPVNFFFYLQTFLTSQASHFKIILLFLLWVTHYLQILPVHTQTIFVPFCSTLCLFYTP